MMARTIKKQLFLPSYSENIMMITDSKISTFFLLFSDKADSVMFQQM